MAFYSGTDNNNDKSGIYYSGVIGKLTDKDFAHVIRFNLYEQKKECTLEDVFETPPKKAIVVPQDWLDQVDNKTQYQSRLPAPYQRQPSLWDQRADSKGMPFGFDEIDASDIRGKTGGKGKNGKKLEDLDDDDIGNFSNWLGAGLSGEVYVPGPLDGSELNGIPGFDDEINDDYLQMYGKEAAEAHELIDNFLINLENCDEPLQDIISMCYEMLTDKGKMKIAHNGLR